MPLDFRYHLASLAAVFAALVLGILLGVAMKEGPALSNQVQDLSAEFRRSEALRTIDERSNLFNARTQGVLVRHRIVARNIALVSNPVQRDSEQVDVVRRILEEAGPLMRAPPPATVSVEIQMNPALQPVLPDQITAIYQRLNIGDVPTRDPVGDLLRRLAHGLGVGSTQVISALSDAKLITVSGDPSQPVSMVVFLGGSADKMNYLTTDIPFLRGCVERNLLVAATEPLETPHSLMHDYQKVAPITIDNIDRVAGRVALVLALANQQHGHFGYKPTAQDVAPACE
jgi:hypothetical protein